jgi:hypothetical protein
VALLCDLMVLGCRRRTRSPLTRLMSVLGMPAQLVDATQALNLSAGVSNAKVLRGRSFIPAIIQSNLRNA